MSDLRDLLVLTLRYLDGLTDEREDVDLEAMLKASVRHRREFVELCRQHGMVSEVMKAAGATVPAAQLERREPARQLSVRRGYWLSVAACLAVIAGTFVYNLHRSKEFAGVLIARIEAVTRGVEVVRGGRSVAAVVHMPVYPGDRIRTAVAQNAEFVYEGENSLIHMRERTTLDVDMIDQGKRLYLDTGTIDALVDPQPAGRPFVVTTAQAKARVKGTALTLAADRRSTRLEVTEGLVAFTRLSDGKEIDVAAGMYAVAEEGTELAARPIGDVPIAPALRPAGDRRAEARHVDGNVLFRDDFEGGADRWILAADESGDEDGKAAPGSSSFRILLDETTGAPVRIPYRKEGTGVRVSLEEVERDSGSTTVLVLDSGGLRKKAAGVQIFADLAPLKESCSVEWSIYYLPVEGRQWEGVAAGRTGRWIRSRTEHVVKPSAEHGGALYVDTFIHLDGVLAESRRERLPEPGLFVGFGVSGKKMIDDVVIRRLVPAERPGNGP